jgi:hypothetical protein
MSAPYFLYHLSNIHKISSVNSQGAEERIYGRKREEITRSG